MSDPSTPAWLTTSQAAALLKVSERTVQRRCKSGKLTCRLVTNDSGEVWEVEAATLPTGDATSDDSPHSQPGDGADTSAQVTTEADDTADTLTTLKSDLPTGDDSVTTPAFVAHLLEENRFLRGLIEQRDRDAAEMRAALRDALKLNARALMEPGDSSDRSTPEVAARAPEAPPVATGEPARKGWFRRLFGE